MRQRGFTLIELLVVIVIISALLGILLPSLSAARSRSKQTACAATLHQLGVAIRSYLDGNSDIFPYASFMPSYGPGPLWEAATPIYIADVLLPHIGGETKVFHCPNDIGSIFRGEPNNNRPYFDTEKSSYQYRTRFGGITMEMYLQRRKTFTGNRPEDTSLWILSDYDNFHGEGGKPGARRYLYYDGHVEDFVN